MADVQIIKEYYKKYANWSLNSEERFAALGKILFDIAEKEKPGGLVECGVWRGGTIAFLASLCRELGLFREVRGYDTFSAVDGGIAGEEVWGNLGQVWYVPKLFHLVFGNVLETTEQYKPEQIALLIIDVQGYAATQACLYHLLSLVKPGGYVMLDEYHRCEKRRKAIQEFFKPESLIETGDKRSVYFKKEG